jgi:hypothetical protein
MFSSANVKRVNSLIWCQPPNHGALKDNAWADGQLLVAPNLDSHEFRKCLQFQ